MYINDRVQYIALKRLLRSNYRVTIKDALEKLKTVNNNVLDKRVVSSNVKIDNMLRLSDIEQCNKILMEM